MDIRTERLREAFRNTQLTQSELCAKTGLNKGALSSYLSGRYFPKQDALEKLSKALNVSIPYLMGHSSEGNISSASASALRIPVYGKVPAGIPLEAIEDVIDYEEIPTSWAVGDKEFFALRVSGDSMSPKYLDGDTIILEKCDDCESGSDCVVYVNGFDATLKKVLKKMDGLVLQPLNPAFEPIFCGYNDDIQPAKIVGRVVELRRKV